MSQFFATKADCMAYLRSVPGLQETDTGGSFFPAGTYYLQHGEYSQPDYMPRRYKDGWAIHKQSHYYGGTCYPGYSGRVLHTAYGFEPV